MAGRTVSINYVGRSASAIVAAKEVAAANELAAEKTSRAWKTSQSVVSGQFGKLGSLSSKAAGLAASPWVQAAATVGVAGAAIVVSAVKAATAFDVTHQQLVTAAAQVGESMKTYGGAISTADDKMVNLGFTVGETEKALTSLTIATHDVNAATKLAGEAADIARLKHIPLSAAADVLGRAVAGNNRAFKQFFIDLRDGSGNLKTHTELMKELAQVVGGQATAAMKTLAGQTDVLNAKLDQLKISVGEKAKPLELAGLKTANQDLGVISVAIKTQQTGLHLLGRAWDDVFSAAKRISPVSFGVKKSTDAADANTIAAKRNADALAKAKAEADAAGFAYLGLGSKIKTAADAFNAISKASFAPLQTSIGIDNASQSAADAISAIRNPDTGGGGGASGPTAAQAAVDLRTKELSLRDAYLGVKDAARGVSDAQKGLTQAHKDQATAAHELGDAQQNLRTVLHGVASDSDAAKTAIDGLKSAQNSLVGGKLDQSDARRALEQAKNDQPLLDIGVRDAQRQLQTDQNTPGVTGDQIQKDQIAVRDAQIAQSAGTDNITRAQNALSDSTLALHGKTKDLTKAQYDLNGTLKGYPKNSREAKDAQDQFNTAQQNAVQAAQGVHDAYRSIADAQRNVANASLTAYQTQADIDGKLGSLGGASSAAGKYKTLKLRVDDAATAIIDLATQAGAADQAVTGSIGHSLQTIIGNLELYAATDPLLAGVIGPTLAKFKGILDAQIAQQFASINSNARKHGSGIAAGFGRASGGPVSAGRSYLIGEHGPELLQMGSQSGHVVPNSALQNSRPMVVVNINGPILGTDVGKVVHQELKKITARDGFVGGVRTAG